LHAFLVALELILSYLNDAGRLDRDGDERLKVLINCVCDPTALFQMSTVDMQQ